MRTPDRPADKPIPYRLADKPIPRRPDDKPLPYRPDGPPLPHRPDDKPLPRLLLAHLLETPDASAFEEARTTLARNPESRRRLRLMLALELALASGSSGQSQCPAGEGIREPLGSELRTLEESASALPPQLETRLVSIPHRTANTARRSRLIALAAMVLLSVGIWYSLRNGTRDASVPGHASERGAVSGESSPASVPAPLTLWVQEPSAEEATVADLEPIGQDRWRAEVNANAWIQLRVVRPDHVPFGETWTATATLARQPSGTAEEMPLELEPLVGTGISTTLEVNVGNTIDLSQLGGAGFEPGDTLVFVVQRAHDVYRLEIPIGP